MTAINHGRRVASILNGAWRPDAAKLRDGDLADIARRLQDDGLSSLIWNRLPPAMRRTRWGREFRQGAIGDSWAAGRLDDILVAVVAAMRKSGVEPIVTKGWAVARYYPSPANRPYGDVDISVRPDQAVLAREILESFGNGSPVVDLHVGIPDLGSATWNAVFTRTRLVELNGFPLRVLAREDQFQLLVGHLLRHFCNRPLNLVDIAVLLEGEQDMNWELCLRGSHAWRRWVLATAALARQLLGAELPDPLERQCPARAPSWLESATLWHWGGGDQLNQRAVLSRPCEWWPTIAHRSLNIVRWAYRFGMPPLRLPQPIWAAAVLGRGLQPINRVWRGLFKPRRTPQPYQVHSHPVF